MSGEIDPLTGDPIPRATIIKAAQLPANNEDATPVDLSTLTDDDLRQECKESLVLMLRGSKGDLRALGAVRELLDRIEGKPVQRVATKDMTDSSPKKAALARSERIAKFLGIECSP